MARLHIYGPAGPIATEEVDPDAELREQVIGHLDRYHGATHAVHTSDAGDHLAVHHRTHAELTDARTGAVSRQHYEQDGTTERDPDEEERRQGEQAAREREQLDADRRELAELRAERDRRNAEQQAEAEQRRQQLIAEQSEQLIAEQSEQQ